MNINIEEEKPWWAIYVDIEGYSEIFRKAPTKGRFLAVSLSEDVCMIASKLLCGTFGFYQFGVDGFLIKPVSVSAKFSSAVSISVALLRMALTYNSVRKVKISYGDLGDFSSYFEDIKRNYNAATSQDFIDIRGQGTSRSKVLFASHVVGSALIRAHGLQSPHGPLLCIDSNYVKEISELQLNSLPFSNERSITINWLNQFNEEIENEIHSLIGEKMDLTELNKNYKKYLEENCSNLSPECEWLKNANSLLK
jgi:hypothetical protein